MPSVYVQLLAGDQTPSILLFVDGIRYLFNIPEGTQRFCMEHHVKLGKMNGIFLSGLNSTYTGGLPGMLMTLADAGKSKINICGPPGTAYFMASTKYFFRRSNMDLNISECCPTKSTNVCIYNDKIIKVITICLQKYDGNNDKKDDNKNDTKDNNNIDKNESSSNIINNNNNNSYDIISNNMSNKRRKLNKGVLHLPSFPEKNIVDSEGQFKSLTLTSLGEERRSSFYNDETISYICETRSVRGKFYPKIAIEKGVPKGPLFGKLSLGEDVVLEDGTIVYSKDCKAPDELGAIFAIINCPTEEYLKCLLDSTIFEQYMPKINNSGSNDSSSSNSNSNNNNKNNNNDSEKKRISCIFHFCPSIIFNSTKYKSWKMLFGENVHHILANKDVNQNTAEPMQATLRQCILLNKIHSRIFAIPPVSLSTETRTDNSEKMILNCLSKIQLIPAEKFSFDYSSCINETKIHEEVEIIMNDISNSKFAHYVNCMKNAEKKNKNNNKENPTITFLGTGSAQPSKYRNVSGIHIGTSNGDFLLDCGEGTYGQLSRCFGYNKLFDKINNIKMVFISHMHADHHLGLRTIIKARTDDSKMVIIGPFTLKLWLTSCSRFEYDGGQKFLDKFYFVNIENSATHFGWGFPRWCDEKNDRKNELAQELNTKLDKILGIKMLESVRVKHCNASYGLILDQNINGDSWRLVYSGDARPSDELIQYGQNADLLIHEATFDDSLVQEAKNRFHSTTGEALEVARKMKAKHTILTHFSQRYPKISSTKSNEGNEDDSGAVVPPHVLAFDMMSINLNDMPWLPLSLPALQCLFPAVEKKELEEEEKKNSV